MKVITLTTDFGTRDWFVGTMKGVILGINPRCRVVDLSHDIPAGDIRAGAFALAAAAPYFPKNTIHVVVIDPGVGGSRRAIAAKTQRALFVGPDNGVLSPSLANEEVRTVRLLENHELFLDDVSRTFHGRDIFAPVAAHLSNGMGFRKVGPRANSYVELNLPKPAVTGDIIRGEILHIDRFGNAISNIPQALLPRAATLQVWVNGRNAGLVEACYDAAPVGTPVSVIGSTGFLEIAINGGSAAMALGLTCGTPIRITREQISS